MMELPPVIQRRRKRFNSRDIVNTYSGQYGCGSDTFIPFECMRMNTIHPTIFLSTYLVLLAFVYILSSMISSSIILTTTTTSTLTTTTADTNPTYSIADSMEDTTLLTFGMSYLYHYSTMIQYTICQFWDSIIIDSWTITNLLHLLITILSFHWLKGQNTFLFISEGVSSDQQGEMNAMTTWEQLEAVPDSENVLWIRRLLLVVPTLLTYIACVACQFHPTTCSVNIVLWSIALVAKLPCMNGVRLFGINRTAGIDDFD